VKEGTSSSEHGDVWSDYTDILIIVMGVCKSFTVLMCVLFLGSYSSIKLLKVTLHTFENAKANHPSLKYFLQFSFLVTIYVYGRFLMKTGSKSINGHLQTFCWIFCSYD
jgi:hypothetical protein